MVAAIGSAVKGEWGKLPPDAADWLTRAAEWTPTVVPPGQCLRPECQAAGRCQADQEWQRQTCAMIAENPGRR